MKVRSKIRGWTLHLNSLLRHCDNVTIMHLGRGGVNEDGTLDAYNKGRVEDTLRVTRAVVHMRPQAKVQIVWTGGCNRQQDRDGTVRTASEAGAALQYATTMIYANDTFTMLTEETSTSTVENATAAADIVPSDGVIVVVTDPLHYVARKVQFILWLVFPGRRLVFIELPTSPPNTTWKQIATHLVSTFVTVAGMIGVRRGDATAVQRRQVWLQDHTGH